MLEPLQPDGADQRSTELAEIALMTHSNEKPRHWTMRSAFGAFYWAVAVGMACTLIFSAQATAANKDEIKIIDPSDLPAIIYPDSPSMKDGRQVHKRPVSFSKDGSRSIDVSLTRFKAGISVDKPFTYKLDEVCYQIAGEAEVQNDGIVTLLRPGNVYWHPAGAPTESVKVLKDREIVCAFGPARLNDTGHRIATPEVGQWMPDEARRPITHIYDWRHVGPVSPQDRNEATGVVRRLIVSAEKDGATMVDLSHTTYRAGTSFGAYAYEEAEVCFIEAGEIELITPSAKLKAVSGQFIYRPAGAESTSTTAVKDTTAICFFGPARRPGTAQELQGP